MDFNTPLKSLTGIGPTLVYKLSRLNLFTIKDLIYHFPFRYDDFSNISSATEARIGENVTLQGEIWSIKNVYTRSRKILTQAIFNDGTSPINLTWFNQGWLTKQIQVGDKIQISGKLSKYKNKLSIIVPKWEKVSVATTYNLQPTTLHTGKLVAVYPETEGLTSKWFRTKITMLLPQILKKIQDPLPEIIRNNMLTLTDSLEKIHSPKDWEEIEKARERLGFDELFYVQLATLSARQKWQNKIPVDTFQVQTQKLEKFTESLPFKLTNSQNRVVDEIISDLKKGQPMNRLVQGEVGSGKTIVAAIASYITYLNGFKTLYMAPTEILAFQHFETLNNLLSKFGIKVGIYTGSKKFTKIKDLRLKINEKKNHKPALPAGRSLIINRKSDPHIIVGTHALLSNKLKAEQVGLVIIDEQQRFGVEQRSILRSKAKIPHFLTMTATPIPRTIALTIYGDLDLSIIDEMPVGRKPVKTFTVPSKRRADAYKFIAKKVDEGDQIFIITPLIEQSETLQSVKAAKVEFERLKKTIFPNLKLGLMHGRLKSKEKEQVLADFKNRKINILVSTSVVEVGMDISNATIMVIEGAERFGLAQLHQLRGRVGRGSKESFCFLFSEDAESLSRLKNLEKIYDGLQLAELDLKIRGSGEIFGQKQSGRFEFKIASFSNLTLIEKTKKAAEDLLSESPSLDKYPKLASQLQTFGNAMPD